MNPISDPSSSGTALAGAAVPFAALCVLVVVLVVAAYTEIRERRIPNWLTFSGIALGMGISALNGSSAFWSSVAGFSIGFGFLFVFYVFGGIGGGDVKLMGAAGALMGSSLIQPAVVYTAFIGAFLSLLMLVWRKDFWLRLRQGVLRLKFWAKPPNGKDEPSAPIAVPYGIAIVAGCLLAIVVSSGH